MKFNKIMIAGILLLAIITLTAVSAADDAANLTAGNSQEIQIETACEDNVEMASDIDDAVSESPQLDIETPSEVKWGEKITANATVSLPSEELYASIYVYDSYFIDEDDDGYVTEADIWNENSTSFSFSLRGYGEHNLEFRFKSSDEQYQTSVYKTVTVKDYTIYVSPGETYYWNDDAWLYLYIPSCLSETVKVTVNGKGVYYNYYDKEEGYRMDDYVVVRQEHLKYGLNNITIEYPGDDKGNAAKTFQDSIFCTARIKMPNEFEYKGHENITLELPSDAS